jgi:hypothetical protein
MELAPRVAEMPLARHAAVLVAGRRQQFGQRVLFRRNSGAGPRWHNGAHEAEAQRPATGHQSRTRGRAHGARAEIREVHTGRGKPIEVGRRDDLAAIEPHIRKTQVVGHHDEEIGPGRIGSQQ